MTLRRATFADVPAMVELLKHHHARSIYARAGNVDEDYTRKLLAQMVQRHLHTKVGGCCVFVVEGGDRKVCAFVAGILDRVYGIGDIFVANDMFTVAGPDAPVTAALRLIAAYIQWAIAIPRVHEIRLSHTDALPEGERVGAIYERMGFTHCGSVYRRETGSGTQ